MELFCFGDSHARYFRKCNTLRWSGFLDVTSPRVHVFDYVAASAKGFAAGPASRFAYKKFMRDFDSHTPERVCMAFGQVDAEVGHYYRRYIGGSTESAETDLSRVFADYIHMAETALPGRPIAFKGLNPSTLRIPEQLLLYAYRRLVVRISHEAERERIWDHMKEDPPTVEAHARINIMANEVLRKLATARGHLFFDIRDAVEDPEMPGMARWDLIPAESDVHLTDNLLVRRLHQQRLFATFEGVDVQRIEA